MDKIKFSIIMPVYNCQEHLKKSIDSILKQTYSNFELILINDGSTDNSLSICKKNAKEDSRIILRSQKNKGLVNARKRGLSIASGDYIVYVDADDWIDKELLDIAYKKLNKYDDIDLFVFGATKIFQQNSFNIPFYLNEGLYDRKKLESDVFPYALYDYRKKFYTSLIFQACWNKIYKTEFLKKHYCKNEKIKMGEDSAFVFECIYNSNKVYFCKDVLYFYNQTNSSSMTKSYDKNIFYNNYNLIRYVENNLPINKYNLDIQINAFKTYWLIIAILHESYHCNSIINLYNKIRNNKFKNELLKEIDIRNFPILIKIYIILLKLNFIMTVIFISKIKKIITNNKNIKFGSA